MSGRKHLLAAVAAAATLGIGLTRAAPGQVTVLPPGPRAPKSAPAPKPSSLPAGIPVATLVVLGSGVEKADVTGAWKTAGDGERLRTGERVRTGPAAVVRLELPWMALNLGSASELFVPPSPVLSAVLERGRAELFAEGTDLLKLRTPESEVRGRGRLVVRRERDTTLVMAMAGAFRVEGSGKFVSLAQGQGLVVPAGAAPREPVDLPRPPDGVAPGADPVYVRQGQPLTVSFRSPRARHHLQVLAFEGAEIQVEGDVGASPQAVRIPWLGTYRLLVSSIDDRGLEGPPSAPGYAVVVEE